MKRTISALALSGTIALIGAAGATAAEYPAPAPNVSVSDGTIAPGESVTFAGSGFTPGEEIDITATNEGTPQASGGGFAGGRAGASVGQKIFLPSVVTQIVVAADADGNFSTSISLPEAGTYQLTAKGRESGTTRTAVVSVVAPVAAPAATSDNASGFLSGGATDVLANTGFPVAFWAAAGLGGLVAGGISVRAAKRKAKETPAS